MQILAHDENSLTNLLFSEVHRHGKIQELLQAIAWRNHAALPFAVRDAELHQQLGLSQFGRPDAFLLVTDGDGRFRAVIIEAKLGLFRDACEEPLVGRLFDKDCNSMLNNQLALRYRAMRALLSLAHGDLREQPHLAPSPYASDFARSCQKPSTLTLLRRLSPLLADFYLVALTLDRESPLLTLPATDPYFPLLFRQDTQLSDEAFPNLGWVSWHACAALFEGIEDHFRPSYDRLVQEGGGLDEVGEEDDRVLVGRHIVLYQGRPCLFSGKGYSCKLHQWQGTRFKPIREVTKDRQAYQAVCAEIRHLQAAPRENMDNEPFWTTFFRDRQPPAEDAVD